MPAFPLLQKEDRLILRDLKIWIEQFERDLTRAQMMEVSLQDKYQVIVFVYKATILMSFLTFFEESVVNVIRYCL